MLLFEEAPAGMIEDAGEQACRELGAAIARLHQATDTLSAEYDRPVMDFDSVANGVLPYAEQYLPAAEFRYLMDTAALFSSELQDLTRDKPGFGLCHADLVTSNIRRDAEAGITFFDFGNASYTWRVFDIAAAHGNVTLKLSGNSAQVLDRIVSGYSSIQAIPGDFARLLPAMRVLRRLGWIGGNSATLPLRRGTEPLEGDLFTGAIKSIRRISEEFLIRRPELLLHKSSGFPAG